MMKNLLRISSIAILTFFVVFSEGCYYDNAEDLYPKDTVFVSDTTGVSWVNDVKPIISANCATPGCHTASSSVRQPLTSYDEVKSAIENWQLKSRVESGAMPPTGTLSDADKNDLLNWIENDYPNN